MDSDLVISPEPKERKKPKKRRIYYPYDLFNSLRNVLERKHFPDIPDIYP